MNRKILHLKYPWGASWTGMLLIAGEENILIDTALPEAVDGYLFSVLEKEGLPVESLNWVFNTHSHGDHAGGNKRLRELCRAKFAIHRDGAGPLKNSGFQPDFLLEDEMVLECGDTRLRVIHTPGHSPDSVCFLDPESRTLFTGDALQGMGTPYSGIALYQSPAAYRKSVDRIEALYFSGEIERICCGHECPPYDGSAAKEQIPEFLRMCRNASLNYTLAAKKYLPGTPARMPGVSEPFCWRSTA